MKRKAILGLSLFGCSVLDNNIGSKANDSKIDTRINKSTFAGSPKFNKN